MILVISEGLDHGVATIFDLCDRAAVHNKEWILLDFYADWCKPCQKLGEIIEKAHTDPFLKNVLIVKINVDGKIGGQLAHSFNVRGIPVLFLLKASEQNPKSPLTVCAKKVGIPDNFVQWIHETINQ
jgi:thioredoxin 1